MVFLINVMSWTVFTLGEDVPERLSLDITLFLALVALNFVVTGFIPKVSYTTNLSTYFVFSYALLTFSTLHNVIIYFLHNYYCTLSETQSTNISNVSTQPTRCWTALYYDWIVLMVVALGTIIYTLVFIIKGSKTRPGETFHKTRQLPSPSIYDDLPLELEQI